VVVLRLVVDDRELSDLGEDIEMLLEEEVFDLSPALRHVLLDVDEEITRAYARSADPSEGRWTV
jgi:hypothetical protein